MADAHKPQTTPSTKSTWGLPSLMGGLSLSRVQAVVGTLAGITSVVGAGFSLVQFARPANTGDLVTIVQAAGSRGNVTDATIEVLTPENTIVATLTPDSSGRVTKELTEGVYVVRVSHPRYAPEVRRVQVIPRQTVEMRASLKAGSPSQAKGSSAAKQPSPVNRAVDEGVNAVWRRFVN